VEQKIYAFKINIQRARQMVSPEYPAVVVGDAAVTPHPDTGMGYTTGFRGFGEVRELLGALSRTTNDATAFLSFNSRYEIVAQKALNGTQSICDSNIGLLTNYKESLEELEAQSKSSSITKTFATDIKLIDTLIQILESSRRTAKIFEDLVKDRTAGIATPPMWFAGPSDLWNRMGRTWDIIQKLTGQKSLLKPQLQALQDAIVKHT